MTFFFARVFGDCDEHLPRRRCDPMGNFLRVFLRCGSLFYSKGFHHPPKGTMHHLFLNGFSRLPGFLHRTIPPKKRRTKKKTHAGKNKGEGKKNHPAGE